ncbi:hypothetical protein [Clostridium sardiniense]|uniref:hypothetical protein n=1 Tax=Clostridium sardiniense TaxID=29369 RepID=UPI003D32702E
MLIKKRGYVLISSFALITFITLVILGGVTIFKMNLKYSSKYKIHESMMDLRVTQRTILDIVNKWALDNSEELINGMEDDVYYNIGDRDYNIKLTYLKSEDTFKINYGIKNLDNYMYCTYRKYLISDDEIKDPAEKFNIILILKREVIIE